MTTDKIKQIPSNTLVLGGGGVTGIAWMTGLLLGLQRQGLKLTDVDRIIGTSAGSTVAAQISSGEDLQTLFQKQTEPALQVEEITPKLNILKLIIKFLPALLAKKNPIKFRQRVGKAALRSKTVSAAARQKVIQSRLPSHTWPEIQLDIMAVDASSGDVVNFSQSPGVHLVDAVAASCAVPGIWPCVSINGKHYYDGGIRSGENADFAKGAANVLIISPTGVDGPALPGSNLRDEIALLESTGSKVTLISPDAPSKAAMGKNPLDPSKRAAAAKAGFEQGCGFSSAAMASIWREAFPR